METVIFDSFESAIQARYNTEAKTNSNLSCGNAFSFAEIQQGENILDLGCGKGRDAIAAALITGDSGFVYGVDLSAAMIEQAQTDLNFRKITNVKFLLSNFEQLSLESDSVDLIISNCALNHAKDKFLVFSEMFRVLKKCGRFIISDIVAEVELSDEIRNDPDARSQCYGGAVTREQLWKVIQLSGFKELEILEKSEPYSKNGVILRKMTLKASKLN